MAILWQKGFYVFSKTIRASISKFLERRFRELSVKAVEEAIALFHHGFLLKAAHSVFC